MNTYFAKFMTTLCTAALIFPASVFANTDLNIQDRVSDNTRKLQFSAQAMNNHGMRFFSQDDSMQVNDELQPQQISQLVQSGKIKKIYSLLPFDPKLNAQIGVKMSSLNISELGQTLQIELMRYDANQGKLLSFAPKVSTAISIDYQTGDATQIKLLIDQSIKGMYKHAQDRIFAAFSPLQKAKLKLAAFGKSVTTSILPTAHAMPEMPGMESISWFVAWGCVALMSGAVVAFILGSVMKGATDIKIPMDKLAIYSLAVAIASFILVRYVVSPYLSNSQYGSSDDKDDK